ncbi:YwmB family TATA-box binding protein [Bacillus salitolerans]|uniref:YwmB family TATA-box binding protein n=1 Tax=Bacillus salitolerans TaxID=1437434 RepID=A0ABW4LRK3_9BACI
MKLFGIITTIFFLINILPSESYDFLEIVEVAEQEEITITSWKIYIKSTTRVLSTLNDVEREIGTIIKQDESYSWEPDTVKKKHHYKKIGRRIDKEEDTTEIKTITVFRNNDEYYLHQSIEVTGTTWTNEKWETIYSKYKNELNTGRVYFSVYGTTKRSDLIKRSNSLLKVLSAKEIESMEEQDFVSVTAFVEDWEFSIPTKDNQYFNLQFGFRVEPDKDNILVSIGTPLITSGY